jgi:hypothetical protein
MPIINAKTGSMYMLVMEFSLFNQTLQIKREKILPEELNTLACRRIE